MCPRPLASALTDRQNRKAIIQTLSEGILKSASDQTSNSLGVSPFRPQYPESLGDEEKIRLQAIQMVPGERLP